MSSQIQMTGSKTSAATTCLFSVLISVYVVISFTDRSISWSILNTSVFPITGAFILAVFVVVAARATVVAWITVLVLLAFTGKRRRVLAAQGRKITAEVAMYLVEVVLKERGAAVTCATILSLMAMSCFTYV
ncbi:Zinc transporter 7 like [Actinidia chinensis var. chinensis]|uniref:Zinc transporter 7 like n=1 Tax=Actinidia chinensis var. chinensis TaxID=1590841 RepID=A0A2R6QGJ0_ACTCC|nr:Zinc transporter 7 like [Actinidia chinensis var. chinensis]